MPQSQGLPSSARAMSFIQSSPAPPKVRLAPPETQAHAEPMSQSKPARRE
jgi:hypothetical protein